LEAVVPTPITFHIFDRSGQHVRSETLTQDVIKIGKLDSSHLKLEDEGVSRMHSVVEVSAAGEVFVIDLGSTTGTIVNGQRVSKAQLNPGDQLQFGNLTVQIDFGEGEEEAEEPPPAPLAEPATVLGYAPPQPYQQPPAYAQQQPPAAARPASRTATMMGNQSAQNPFAAPASPAAAFGATQQGFAAPQQN
jgi:pSer/pThr/pTyr-binding forkhead associated (FHA) protein